MGITSNQKEVHNSIKELCRELKISYIEAAAILQIEELREIKDNIEYVDSNTSDLSSIKSTLEEINKEIGLIAVSVDDIEKRK
jgi:predicted RNA-binding protein with EMAP domain